MLKKKYVFALVFIFSGSAMGALALLGLKKVTFNNKGMPISILLIACASLIIIGLLFIILGKK